MRGVAASRCLTAHCIVCGACSALWPCVPALLRRSNCSSKRPMSSASPSSLSPPSLSSSSYTGGREGHYMFSIILELDLHNITGCLPIFEDQFKTFFKGGHTLCPYDPTRPSPTSPDHAHIIKTRPDVRRSSGQISNLSDAPDDRGRSGRVVSHSVCPA